MKLYNTLSRKKEIFVPQNPKNPTMYVCGPTVYDRAHIGNARPVVVFDVLFRLLKYKYGQVTYARNITDIDDKIIAASQKNQTTIQQITQKYTQLYNQDMAALGAAAPTHTPRATDHIPHMIDMISTLIKNEHAYANEGHVLFDVVQYSTYGKLSKLKLDDQIDGARVDVAPYKKNPQDFVLWKPSTEDQPGWDSPWGRGRPGWHIECSAMAKAHLGKTVDIHGGGLDLIFPHHENEIAQSECAHKGDLFARFWLHNGHVVVNGEKMSKSLGNFFTVDDLLKKFPGEAIRLTLLSTHYRHPLDWRDDVAQQNKTILDRFYQALEGSPDSTGEVSDPFLAALEDDLNIPETLSVLHDLVGKIHKAKTSQDKAALQQRLKASANLLGCLQQTPAEWFQGSTTQGDVSWIEDLIVQRAQAKAQKDYQKADEIRDSLDERGIILEDKPTGTTWKKK